MSWFHSSLYWVVEWITLFHSSLWVVDGYISVSLKAGKQGGAPPFIILFLPYKIGVVWLYGRYAGRGSTKQFLGTLYSNCTCASRLRHNYDHCNLFCNLFTSYHDNLQRSVSAQHFAAGGGGALPPCFNLFLG